MFVRMKGWNFSSKCFFEWHQREYLESYNGPTIRCRYVLLTVYIHLNCGMRNQAAATINSNDFGCESVEKKINRNTNRNEKKKCEKFIEFFAVNLWTVIWVELRWSSQIWELNVFVTYVGNLVFSSVGSMSIEQYGSMLYSSFRVRLRRDMSSRTCNML